MTTPAYIYRRFSTDEQEHGSSDTLARQLERCEAMARANNWTVAETMTDKGKSAFKGHHLLPDADLGGFMVRLRQGDIPSGSVLIADNLSRLSRRPVDEAMAWIYEVNKAGVTIALADKNEIYEANPEIGDLITRAINLGVAYKSSEEKSKMTTLSKARLWDFAETRTGKWVNLANKLPSWLTRKPTLDGFIVDKDRAAVVQMIYQLSADGVGVNTIVGRLNEAIPPVAPFAKAIKYKDQDHKWGRSGVRQLLTSPNVEGDFRPMTGAHKGRVIHGFYPRIVDADLVARARADLTARRRVSGKSAASGSTNLFAGITTCGECGRRATLTTMVQKGKRYAYVRCEAAGEKRCSNKSGYAYRAFEETVLDLMLDLALDDRFFAATGALRDSRVRKAEIEKTLHDTRTQRARLLRAFAEAEDDQAMDMIRELQVQIDELSAQLVEADEAIKVASGQVGNMEHLRRVGDIREAARSDDETTRVQARSKLRLAMTSIIMTVDIEREDDGDKTFTVILKGGIMAVRINDKGKVKGIVRTTGDDPLWKHISNDHQAALAPLIARIERMAA